MKKFLHRTLALISTFSIVFAVFTVSSAHKPEKNLTPPEDTRIVQVHALHDTLQNKRTARPAP